MCAVAGKGRRLDIRHILRTTNDELFTMALCEVQILARTIASELVATCT